MNFEKELEHRTKEVETIVKSYLPEESGWAKTVMEAMNYSVNVGGKRLRPMLMAETYRLFGGADKAIEPFMAAIEMIHTYSLVHDDLPAMDNDEYRRGKKTTWVVYGDAMAILAGDGLLNYAFETALTSFEMPGSSVAAKAKALSILAKKAGIHGMIGGQTADIEAEHLGGSVTKEHLLFIHEHKTAALIQAAMMAGAVLADASDAQVQIIEQAAYEIGIAFQIQDDILDIIGSEEELGKPIGSDAENNKKTYASVKGTEGAKRDVERLTAMAVSQLDKFENTEFLRNLAVSLINRNK